jgi:hypothetical protein
MNRIKHVVSTATVALALAFATAAMAAGHGGGGFGGHFGGFGGHSGGFGDHLGGSGSGHAPGLAEPVLDGHSFDSGHLATGGSLIGRGHELGGFPDANDELGSNFAGGGHELGGFAGGRHDLGDGITLGARNIGGSHLMYGRVPRFDHRGVFLGYDYPNPQICNQYPGFYNPAVGCYGLEPLG